MCRGCVGDIFGSIGEMRPGLTRRRFLATSVGAAAVGPGAISAFAALSDGVDLIFKGGPIIPMAGDQRTVEALAVKNGRIAAVGAADAIMGLKSPSTQVIDLDGRALLPGFIDPHQHTVTGGLINAIFTDCGYTKFKTRDALLAFMREKAAKTPTGQWLLFTSFDNLLQGGDLMGADLDAISRITRSSSITSTCTPRPATARPSRRPRSRPTSAPCRAADISAATHRASSTA